MDSFEGQWQRWFPQNEGEKAAPPVKRKSTTTIVFLALAVVFAIFILLDIAKNFYTEWLWFSSLSYGNVYTTILQTRLLLFFSAAIVFFLLFFGNFALAARLTPKETVRAWPWAMVAIGTALLSLIFSMLAQGNWQIVLGFFNGQPFGITDPVFHKEIGFYVFSLPFFHVVRDWLLGALIVTLLGSAGIYLFSYLAQRHSFNLGRPVLAHIGALVIAILALFAWGYWLSIWELLFSDGGAFFGAGYADMHARLPAQWILFTIVLICMAAVLVSIWQRKFRWALYAVGTWIIAAIFIGGVFPALIQRLVVQPNELVREKPYIEHNIQFTREAFALNDIEEQSFPAEKEPSPQDITNNDVTISNIRLWDHRPLKDTYNQIQSIRLYYDFHDVDVDRYVIDGKYRQVMLSARELSAEKLTEQAQTWVNRQLQFTHGYGLALSPVNEISTEGLPILMVKDIPPVGKFDIEQPQIYYGEKTNNYVIVNTTTQEFDYPLGDENVYGYYQGKGGVNIGGFIDRLAYAWQFGDVNILISDELTAESKVLYYRNISDRVKHIAPFLELDSDPYLITIDGRLFWIQDAYTVTNRYPYSEPLGGKINYIRNSVKAVIDAYNGDVTFYITDAEDALIRTYQAIFPSLFVPGQQMPDSLRLHLRYPEGMFNIQAAVYQSYHMKDARVFYNKEDLWAVPKEVYAGAEQTIESYYIIMRLPDEQTEEFLLMLPFTPVNKNNTIGWLAARCDGDNYGKLIAYYFPKERLVYGPSQIENRIQQDTVITEQLALWGRGGSRVIRGNLLMIPLGSSNLYVEPVFLQAEAGGLPELKRVIVATGDKIAMRPTLEESIDAIFGPAVTPDKAAASISVPAVEEEPPAGATVEQDAPAGPPITKNAEIANLIEQAQQHYDSAQQYVKDNDWAGYGRELNALKSVLDQLAELTAE
ncbi:MAG: UPF0182 family protein [Dehalococcoidia bacterium]|nr:UPF0182 family protein [Dehalococcoidia bacterium]